MKRILNLLLLVTLVVSFAGTSYRHTSSKESATVATNLSATSAFDWRWFKLPNGPDLSDVGGWDQEQYYSTIQTGDIDGDGRDELLARAAAGIWAYQFDPATNAWAALPNGPAWSNATGWDQPQYYTTIQTGDIDGDGSDELLARDPNGIRAYEFDPAANAWAALPNGPALSDANGWDQPQYYTTIQTADLDGDGSDELLARAAAGIRAYEFDPATNAWAALPNGPNWDNATGWDDPQYYTTIQTGDLDGDGRDELLARAPAGIWAYEFDPVANAWVKLPDGPNWDDATGWGNPQYYTTIQTGDLDGDGRDELLARAAAGILAYEFDPATNAWVALPNGPDWHHATGWDQPQYYTTIHTGDIDGDGQDELLARAAAGILAYEFDPATNAWVALPVGPAWDDATGWDQPQYYSTCLLYTSPSPRDNQPHLV